MKAVVTGANGFIGQYVVDRLRRENYYVVGIGRSDNSKSNADEYIKCDISSEDLLNERILNTCAGADTVIHTAALKNMNNIDIQLINTNLVGTMYVSRLTDKINCKNIVYTSGAPVIGKPPGRLITNDIKEKPVTLYHLTKLAAENIFLLPDFKEISAAVLRIPSPIGVGMPDTFLSVLINKAMNNEDITLFGKGTRKQNYIDVRDIADAVISCVRHNINGCYYIGAENPISNHELAEKCISLLGSSSVIKYSSKPDPADDEIWRLDISEAEKDFCFKNNYNIDDSILWISNERKK